MICHHSALKWWHHWQMPSLGNITPGGSTNNQARVNCDNTINKLPCITERECMPVGITFTTFRQLAQKLQHRWELPSLGDIRPGASTNNLAVFQL